jgi:hypothetical protein
VLTTTTDSGGAAVSIRAFRCDIIRRTTGRSLLHLQAGTFVRDTDGGREDQGCTDGKMETEGSGYFEVDDAKCKDEQCDIKLDKDFKMIAMNRD